jgi:hypothetical protein
MPTRVPANSLQPDLFTCWPQVIIALRSHLVEQSLTDPFTNALPMSIGIGFQLGKFSRGDYAKAQRNVVGRRRGMADSSSRMAGIEGLSIPANGTVLRPIVRSIGEAIHPRSNARTIFNQDVLRIHLEETHSAAMGQRSVGRREKSPSRWNSG